MDAELLRLGSEPPDSPASLREVLDGALATVARLLASREVTLRLDLGADVPPVVVNRLALRHILLNLLGFVVASGQSEELVISADVGTAEVEVSFHLVGPRPSEAPAPPGDEPRGLAMARRLVEMQGGRLRVEMVGGVPARTTLSLPATKATTVLLVDDSADIGRLFRRYLAGTEYYLVHARSAEKARRLVHDVRPGVVLLDVLLPRDDGWQLLESLRADDGTAGVPVVVCSVVPEESLATSLGVEFLPKPVSRTALLASLEKACRQESQAASRGTP
jgi:CheY-like chemotaxis protein